MLSDCGIRSFKVARVIYVSLRAEAENYHDGLVTGNLNNRRSLRVIFKIENQTQNAALCSLKVQKNTLGTPAATNIFSVLSLSTPLL